MSNTLRTILGLMTATVLATVSGCAAGEADGDVDDADLIASEATSVRDGVNSKVCKRSGYNCALNPGRGQRVSASGDESWKVDPNWSIRYKLVDPKTKQTLVPIADGNGELIALSKKTEFTLNYGQTRRFANLDWVIALSAGTGSAGWVPVEAFAKAASLRSAVGSANAKGSNLRDLACFEVGATYDQSLNQYAVVEGSDDSHKPEPDDYLPKKRVNGKVYVNLAFNAPGDALGSPAVDLFPAGTKFQRLDVPTWEKPDRPSLDVKLYSKPTGGGAYSKHDGRMMPFAYGYVKTKTGEVRYGWMALDGLTPSKGCPDRK